MMYTLRDNKQWHHYLNHCPLCERNRLGDVAQSWVLWHFRSESIGRITTLSAFPCLPYFQIKWKKIPKLWSFKDYPFDREDLSYSSPNKPSPWKSPPRMSLLYVDNHKNSFIDKIQTLFILSFQIYNFSSILTFFSPLTLGGFYMKAASCLLCLLLWSFQAAKLTDTSKNCLCFYPVQQPFSPIDFIQW